MSVLELVFYQLRSMTFQRVARNKKETISVLYSVGFPETPCELQKVNKR